MAKPPSTGKNTGRPAPHRAGGLKFRSKINVAGVGGPAPHRAGGLKCRDFRNYASGFSSRPAQGGWIEILCIPLRGLIQTVPPRTGRVD